MTTFTLAEHAAMWRFAIRQLDEPLNDKMWEQFIEKTNTSRSFRTLARRFEHNMLPNLVHTNFHVETKLRLCQKYRIRVTDELFDKLSEEASVFLEKRYVDHYQLKRNCGLNHDKHMTDEEFLKLVDPIVQMNLFTDDEDKAIWKFANKNAEAYTKSETMIDFWRELATKLKSDRPAHTFKSRFETLSKKLHEMGFTVKQKLRMYKCFHIRVDKNYLNTLKEHAHLVVTNGYITTYKMNVKSRAQKRKNTSEASTSAKRERIEEEEEEERETSDDEEEEENVDDTAVGVPERKGNLLNFEVNEEEFDVEYPDQDGNLDRAGPGVRVEQQEEELVVQQEGPNVQNGEKEQNEKLSEKMDQMMKMMMTMQENFEKERKEAKSREDALEGKISAMVQAAMEEKMSAMQADLTAMRKEINTAIPVDPTVSTKKKFLLNFQKTVNTLESPEMDSIKERIEKKVQELPVGDDSLSVSLLRPMLEIVLNAIE